MKTLQRQGVDESYVRTPEDIYTRSTAVLKLHKDREKNPIEKGARGEGGGFILAKILGQDVLYYASTSRYRYYFEARGEDGGFILAKILGQDVLMKLEILFGVVGPCLALVTANGVPVITTQEGKVSGVVEKAINGNPFYSYYGIPYATPPIGELRFQDPTEPKEWEGVRDGSKMPMMCLQVRFGKVMAGIKASPEEVDGNEDCLFLNVFTPKDAATYEKCSVPVLVFIPGGGFFAGGAEEYLPHVILSKDVLVDVQYRLGILGFLSTDDSTIPGNFGLKDQTMALQWVQNNIQNFGGDSRRVTIFGESAGGASVHFQVLTPKAKGLFNGAIMHSGNALCPWSFEKKHAEYAREVGDLVGCSMDEGSQAFLKCLQSVDANQIAVAVQDLTKWFVFPLMASPRVDGDYLPDHPVRLIREGRYNKVNLITGVTADEGAIFSITYKEDVYKSSESEDLKKKKKKSNDIVFSTALLARPDLIPSLESNFEENGPYSIGLNVTDKTSLTLANQYYAYYLGGFNVDTDHEPGITQMMGNRHFKIPHDFGSALHAQHDTVKTYRYEMLYHGQMSISHALNPNIQGNCK
ncbi:esterase E4-like [Palaemon carinicauda]|uniref:esterase E4-like n=1 Tax=Palaemon carinicauda TaxID=392227 RepID=UPI0035B695DE